jgi:transcriptional regulator GlxA family with amidase domain
MPHLTRAVEILRLDVARPFTISALALEVGINSYKLREGFKQLYNMTVYQFRLYLRLEVAMQLLEDTDLTIEQIAYKVGFDSRDSLSRCFRKKFSRSPREWRNEQALKPQSDIAGSLAILASPCRN